MRLGPISPTELGVIVLAALPWLILIVLAAVVIGLLRRSARAQERIADVLARERRST